MELMNKSKEFFANGGMIFSNKHNFLAKTVQALGLAAVVTIFPANASKADFNNVIQPSMVPIAKNTADIVNYDKVAMKRIAAKFADGSIQRLKESWELARQQAAEEVLVETAQKVAEAGVTGMLAEAAEYVAYHSEQVSVNLSVHEFGHYKVPHYVAKEIVRAAKDTNFPAETLFAIAEKESSFDITASPKTSSAFGLMQFLDQKWFEMVKNHGSDYGLEYEAEIINERQNGGKIEYYVDNEVAKQRILNLRTSPYLSAVFTAINLLDAKGKIEIRVNAELSNEELYLPHFLGTNGAGKLLEQSAAKPNIAAAKVFPAAAKANRNMFRGKGGRSLTISQFKDKIVSTIEKRTQKYTEVESIIAEATTTSPEEGKGFLMAFSR
jgi:hypothetical protein